jgi:hypothetical protein
MSTGAVFFANKKRITERNSHLAGEASGSSISNGCQAKTERRRQLAGVRTGRGGIKLHASVAGSRVTAFLATAAPWEPYFTDNLTWKKTKLHGLSTRANYTDRATAACRRSDCQLMRIEGATWSAWRIPTAVFSVFLDRSRYFSIK